MTQLKKFTTLGQKYDPSLFVNRIKTPHNGISAKYHLLINNFELQAWTYLFGKGAKIEIIYKIIFLVFKVLGAAVTMNAVIKFSEAMSLALISPNMIGSLLLFLKVKEELNSYLKKIKIE